MLEFAALVCDRLQHFLASALHASLHHMCVCACLWMSLCVRISIREIAHTPTADKHTPARCRRHLAAPCTPAPPPGPPKTGHRAPRSWSPAYGVRIYWRVHWRMGGGARTGGMDCRGVNCCFFGVHQCRRPRDELNKILLICFWCTSMSPAVCRFKVLIVGVLHIIPHFRSRAVDALVAQVSM